MICTYIFEDSDHNTLAKASNIKNPKVYIDMRPMLRTCMWGVEKCERLKLKGRNVEKTITRKPVQLVGAVLSAHDKVLINTAHNCFSSLRSEEPYFCMSDNSIFVPEQIIGKYIDEQGEPVRGIDVKPSYIKQITIGTSSGLKTYYAVSVIYTGSIYDPSEGGKYFRKIQPDLVDLADQILDLNNISHTKNKPYHRYGHTYIEPSHTRVTMQHSEFDDIGFNVVCNDKIWYGQHILFSEENNFILPQKHNTWVYNMPKGTIFRLMKKHLNNSETELFSLATFNIYNDTKFTKRIAKTFQESGEF